MFAKPIRAPILTLLLLSLGGLLLHIRIHSPGSSAFNIIPIAFGVVTTAGVPLLFAHRRTAPWGYLLNLASVIVGAVTMAYFTMTHWQGPITWQAVLLKSTLADILILAAKVPMGELIRQHYHRTTEPQRAEHERTI